MTNHPNPEPLHPDNIPNAVYAGDEIAVETGCGTEYIEATGDSYFENPAYLVETEAGLARWDGDDWVL